MLIWPLTTDGEYSVRSAYHFLVATEDSLAPSSSSLVHDHSVWKKIWKMKVNLKARHVPVDDVCKGCGDYLESTLHFLWLCDQAGYLDVRFGVPVSDSERMQVIC